MGDLLSGPLRDIAMSTIGKAGAWGQNMKTHYSHYKQSEQTQDTHKHNTTNIIQQCPSQ